MRRDLRDRVQPGAHIAFGVTTDPYPPLEARERVMFRALSALLDASGLRVSVTTRSKLVARDAKLLGLLAQRHAVHVNLVVATPDPRLARFLEPDAPAPDERWNALNALRRHGVGAGALLNPLLPGVTDADTDLDALCADAAEAGARWLGAQLVVPDEPACARLLRELRRAYPRVAARFAWWTRYAAGGPGSGTERRPSRRLSAPQRTQLTQESGTTAGAGAGAGTGRQRPRSDAACADTLGRLHQLATRYGLAVRPGLALPVPRQSRQATFAFPAPAAQG